MPRHECAVYDNGRQWQMCCMCDGRVHLPGCTSKRDKNKDCCELRHKMLHDAGEKFGLVDSSYVMWAMNYPCGYHPFDVAASFIGLVL